MRPAAILPAAALVSLLALPAQAQDAAAGERVFKIQCSACHTVVPGKNLVGPSLHGVIGRTTGQVLGFRYTEANRNAKLTLDAETLDRYLTNPREVIPGTSMVYAGVKDATQRKNLIAYLETLR
jgi:cytochrome c